MWVGLKCKPIPLYVLSLALGWLSDVLHWFYVNRVNHSKTVGPQKAANLLIPRLVC